MNWFCIFKCLNFFRIIIIRIIIIINIELFRNSVLSFSEKSTQRNSLSFKTDFAEVDD